MGVLVSKFIKTLVSEEIRRIVAAAAKERTTISATTAAAEVRFIYPNCGLTEWDIADAIIMAAEKAGVPVEVGQPRAA